VLLTQSLGVVLDYNFIFPPFEHDSGTTVEVLLISLVVSSEVTAKRHKTLGAKASTPQCRYFIVIARTLQARI